jgi:hypothetical protein
MHCLGDHLESLGLLFRLRDMQITFIIELIFQATEATTATRTKPRHSATNRQAELNAEVAFYPSLETLGMKSEDLPIKLDQATTQPTRNHVSGPIGAQGLQHPALNSLCGSPKHSPAAEHRELVSPCPCLALPQGSGRRLGESHRPCMFIFKFSFSTSNRADVAQMSRRCRASASMQK